MKTAYVRQSFIHDDILREGALDNIDPNDTCELTEVCDKYLELLKDWQNLQNDTEGYKVDPDSKSFSIHELDTLKIDRSNIGLPDEILTGDDIACATEEVTYTKTPGEATYYEIEPSNELEDLAIKMFKCIKDRSSQWMSICIGDEKIEMAEIVDTKGAFLSTYATDNIGYIIQWMNLAEFGAVKQFGKDILIKTKPVSKELSENLNDCFMSTIMSASILGQQALEQDNGDDDDTPFYDED